MSETDFLTDRQRHYLSQLEELEMDNLPEGVEVDGPWNNEFR